MAAATSALARPCPASVPARLGHSAQRRGLSALGLPALRAGPLRASRASRPVAVTASSTEKREGAAVCQSNAEAPRDSAISKAVAMMVAGALVLSPMLIHPPQAEAAKGGARVGGSSGFSRSRTAPPPKAEQPSTRTTNVIVAPSVMPFGGFMPFGGLGFGWSPFGYAPMFGFGPSFGFIFSGLIFIVVASVVVSVITSVFRRN